MKYGMTINKKFNLLSKYMGEFIDSLPNRIQPFDNWIDSYMEAKKHEGRKKTEAVHKARCRYCKREFDHYFSKTKDHVVPVSKFGLNIKDNRVLACQPCNVWKDNKSLKDWLKEIVAVIKKGKFKEPYDKSRLGIMVGNIKIQIEEMKGKKNKVSVYKNYEL